MRKALHEAIKEDLTDRQQEMIVMYYFDDITMQEIADEFGVTKQNVSRIIKRGLKRIKNSKKVKKFLNSA